jgi:hypothetical protein
MKWHSGLNVTCICGSYLLFTWLWICIFNIWDVFGSSVEQNDVMLVTAIVSFFVALIVASILIHTPSTAYRRVCKHVIYGMMTAAVVIAVFAVTWIPYNSYSWETAAIYTTAAFVIVLCLALAHSQISKLWYPAFIEHRKLERLYKRTVVTEQRVNNLW